MAKSKPNLNRKVRVIVRQAHIDEGECRDPNKCMIKLAVAEAIGIPHGYIKVDARGIKITRRKDYREAAFVPEQAYKAMLAFDQGQPVEPFTMTLEFHKTTRVYKNTDERRQQINAARRQRKAEGKPDRTYSGPSKRLIGIAMTAESAQRVGLTDGTYEHLGL
jgi:hypothetical protein